MIREYVTPDFDVTVYEIEDVITMSIGSSGANPEYPDEEWYG